MRLSFSFAEGAARSTRPAAKTAWPPSGAASLQVVAPPALDADLGMLIDELATERMFLFALTGQVEDRDVDAAV